MTCRSQSTTPSASCWGANNGGAQLGYDAEGRLVHWQSSPSAPSSSADDLYDGSGHRVEQVLTTSGTTTTVAYLFGGLEEVATTGSTSTLTTYYTAGSLLIGVNVNGTLSYLASDGLGSVSAALDGAGNVQASTLYAPYGGARYSSGTLPTARGFTGQYADATSGLDYYGARYYDPLSGRFTSADTMIGSDPLWDAYAYVGGMVESATDPSGQDFCFDDPRCVVIVLNVLSYLVNAGSDPTWVATLLHRMAKAPVQVTASDFKDFGRFLGRVLGQDNGGGDGPNPHLDDNISNGNGNQSPYHGKEVSRGAAQKAGDNARRGIKSMKARIENRQPAEVAPPLAVQRAEQAEAVASAVPAPSTNQSGDVNIPVQVQVAPGIFITVQVPYYAVQVGSAYVQAQASQVGEWFGQIGDWMQNITTPSQDQAPCACAAGGEFNGDDYEPPDEEIPPPLDG